MRSLSWAGVRFPKFIAPSASAVGTPGARFRIPVASFMSSSLPRLRLTCETALPVTDSPQGPNIVRPQSKLAIVVAGGPAPGINSVIGAATIRACLSDVEVLGVQEGFQWLMQGDVAHITPLTIAEPSRIHFRGGAWIGISRANPTKKPEDMQRVLASLQQLGVGMLITIGGDDTAYSARSLARASGGALRVVHVPKTIDNDLDLPPDVWTFGYQTARHVGVEIVQNLMVDAKTTSRFYFVVAMGRKAGHRALGIGKAAGATLTLIPEEFGGKQVPMAAVVDTL